MSTVRLIELAVRRGELLGRIAMQRDGLAQDAMPLRRCLGVADKGVDGVLWLRRRPEVLAAFFAGVLLVRPRRIGRWLRRGYMLWRGWKALRGRFPG